jgi:hypothetical protein
MSQHRLGLDTIFLVFFWELSINQFVLYKSYRLSPKVLVTASMARVKNNEYYKCFMFIGPPFSPAFPYATPKKTLKIPTVEQPSIILQVAVPRRPFPGTTHQTQTQTVFLWQVNRQGNAAQRTRVLTRVLSRVLSHVLKELVY